MKRNFPAIALIVLLTAAGCTHRGTPPAASTTESMKPGNMTPFDDNNWKDGPAILPKAALLTALTTQNATGNRRLWRLPIVIELLPNDDRAYRQAYIAVEPSIAKVDRIELWLEDSALGVSLQDRVRQYCPNGGLCSLWVAGYWGTDMPASGRNASQQGNKAPYPFALRAVLGTQAGADASNEGSIVKYRD